MLTLSKNKVNFYTDPIPVELVEKLIAAKKEATSPMVVTSPHSNRLPYKWYVKYLKEYCSELALPQIATHGLRHSTSELYIHHGATRDDLRKLFAHSAAHVTDRYIHDRGTNLDRVANVIRLFPDKSVQKVSKKCPYFSRPSSHLFEKNPVSY